MKKLFRDSTISWEFYDYNNPCVICGKRSQTFLRANWFFYYSRQHFCYKCAEKWKNNEVGI